MTDAELSAKCRKCSGKCCRYYTVFLNEPENATDFDELRWFLAHGRNYIYVDGDQWHLNIEAPCRFLDTDGRCLIYEYRPQVCRDFGHLDECEFGGTYGFDMVFRTIPELETYARTVLPPDELKKLPLFPRDDDHHR